MNAPLKVSYRAQVLQHNELGQAKDAGKVGTRDGTRLKHNPGAKLTSEQNYRPPFPITPQQLENRRAELRPVPTALPRVEITQRAPIAGGIQVVRAAARTILKDKSDPKGAGAKGAAKGSRGASATHYMALNLALASLDEDISDAESTAMLTPSRHQGDTPQELANNLLAAAYSSDPEDLRNLMEDIGAALDTSDDEDFRRKLKSAEFNTDMVMEELRKAQKIPQLHTDAKKQDRLALREKIQEEIAEFDVSPEGTRARADFNTAKVALATVDPTTFQQTYTDLVTAAHTLASSMKLLVTRYRIDSLEATVGNLKKALGDDLGAAAPSYEHTRLCAVLTDLGNMSVLSTFIGFTRELYDQMTRLEAAQGG